jgi:diguanylate cyclase (GGDEF)-like protein/PAS domain S-box-containing protein
VLIEDNAGDAELFREMVKGCGACELHVADRLSTGLQIIETGRFDAVFLDLMLPDSSGIDTLKQLQEKAPDLPVIVMTGLADGEAASTAIGLGAQDYLVKGRFDSETLERSVQYSIERKRNEVALRERKELSDAINRLDNLIHSTLDFATILQRVTAGGAQALGAEASVIGLFQNEYFVIKSVYRMEQELVGRIVASREMKELFHASLVRDAVAFNNAPGDPRLNREMIRTLGIRSLLVAPFISRGMVLGAISFFTLSRPFTFRDVHLDFARKLSFSVSTAMENARLYDALRESEQLSRARLSQLQSVYASAPVGLCFVDAGLRYVNINERLAQINGVSPEKHIGRTVRDVLSADLADTIEPCFRQVLESGRALENRETRWPPEGDPEESRFWLSSYYPVRDSAGGIMGVNAVVQEITARKKMEEEIRHLANHDALTGLPNRRLFLELISLEAAQARRHGTRMAVCFLDLDRFKNINDALGHDAGDELLRQVAAGLKATVRSSDTVARIGGDEFNIIVADVVKPEDVADVARKIVDYFTRTFFISGLEFHITTSIGISVFPDDSEEIEALLRYADLAMYHAKERGGNTFQFYNPEINKRSLERMRLENWLSQSVERGELFIQYQPQIDIMTQRVICAEALVRWQHPEMGLIGPERFIPVAEETGFIAAIDAWVLREACRQMKFWIDGGMPPTCITVNLSARLFQEADLVHRVEQILRETGMPPELLDLEITESMAMGNVERTAVRLKELTGMGIHVSIDDFGTGYSSLNYLKRLPIARLKIDKSFVQDITIDPDDRTIISAVTAMAHNMKMKVIAEGVETEDQLAFLIDTGCDEMQGFLFSRPLPAEAFRELVTNGKQS